MVFLWKMVTVWARMNVLMVFNPAEFKMTILFTIFGRPRVVRVPIVCSCHFHRTTEINGSQASPVYVSMGFMYIFRIFILVPDSIRLDLLRIRYKTPCLLVTF